MTNTERYTLAKAYAKHFAIPLELVIEAMDASNGNYAKAFEFVLAKAKKRHARAEGGISMTYRVETDGWAMFSNLPADPEEGLFGGPQPRGLTKERAEAELARLNTAGDWPDGRPRYWIELDG